MEGELGTWLWMAIPLFALAVNLVFPRSRTLKVGALFLLVLAATLHALFAHNQIYRSLAAIGYWISPGNKFLSKEDVLRWLAEIRSAVGLYGLELLLGLTLGIILAAVPCDIVSRFSRRSVSHDT